MRNAHHQRALLKIVRESGAILLKHFGRIKQVRQKEHPSSVVCEADLASEKHSIDRIRREFPHDSIIAEETGFQRGKSSFTWVIDPLDGTSNFVAGLPWFGVQIGILENGKPVASAMYLPLSDDLYYAEAGRGAYKNRTRLKLSTQTDLKKILCAFGFDATGSKTRTRRNASLLTRVAPHVRNTRATNSLVDFCYTLDGGFGACINLNCKIWDIVPVSLILPEAGGKFTDLKGKNFDFSLDASATTRSYEILGAGKALHPQLLRLLKL